MSYNELRRLCEELNDEYPTLGLLPCKGSRDELMRKLRKASRDIAEIQDRLSRLTIPAELFQHEMIKYFDFYQLFNYCQTNRDARAFCVDNRVLEEKIVLMSYIELTNALLYWAQSGVQPRLLVEALSIVYDRIDLHTVQLIYYYFLEQQLDEDAERVVALYSKKRWGEDMNNDKDDSDYEGSDSSTFSSSEQTQQSEYSDSSTFSSSEQSQQSENDGSSQSLEYSTEDERRSAQSADESDEHDQRNGRSSAKEELDPETKKRLALLDELFLRPTVYREANELIKQCRRWVAAKERTHRHQIEVSIADSFRKVVVEFSIANMGDYLAHILVAAMNDDEIVAMIKTMIRFSKKYRALGARASAFYQYLYYELHREGRLNKRFKELLNDSAIVYPIGNAQSSAHYAATIDDVAKSIRQNRMPVLAHLICTPEQIANLIDENEKRGGLGADIVFEGAGYLVAQRYFNQWYKNLISALQERKITSRPYYQPNGSIFRYVAAPSRRQ